MAVDSIVLQEQDFVPIAGPPFVHDFGADLGLEKQRGLSDDLHDRFYPFVFAFV